MTKASPANRNAIESLAFLLAALICIQLSRDKSDASALVPALHPQLAALHQLLFIYGLSFLGLAFASCIVSRAGQSLACLIAAACRPGTRSPESAGSRPTSPSRSDMLWLAGALCVGVAVRGYFLNQPMRYDESYSFLNFVHGDIRKLFWYPTANNHVLNTILEKLSCWLIGPTPVGIRLPALLGGIGLIPLSFFTCRRLAPGSFGILAAYGAALSPYLILFSTTGRGYSLLSLLVLLIIHVSLSRDGTGVTGRWPLPALLSALGLLTMPSAAYALAGLGLWITSVLALQTKSLFKAAAVFLFPYAAVTAMLTLVIYTPVIWGNGGIGSLSSNEDFAALPVHQFAAGILPHLAETFRDFSRGASTFAAVLVIALAIVGSYAESREHNRALASLLPAMLLGSLLLFVLKRSIPPSRTWTYLIPPILICADAGFSFLSRKLPPSIRMATPAAASIAAVCFVWRLTAQDAVAGYPETGRMPDAAAIAEYLSAGMTETDMVCAELPAASELEYYLWRDLAPEQLRMRPRSGRRFLLHMGSPFPDTIWGIGAATVLLHTAEFTLYDWTNADQPKTMIKASCWFPATLSYNL